MTYIPNLTGVTQGINPTTEVLASNGNQSLNVCINDPRSAFNEISVIQPYPLAQIDFVYGISTLVTTSNVQGSNATVTATGALLRCTSNGAGGASSCLLSAKKFVKYRSGQGAMIRTTALFSPPASGSQQLCGGGFALANTTTFIDFIGFGYGNAASPSTFSILWRNGATGADTWIPQSLWNQDTVSGGTKSGMTLNPQVLNHYQVQFQSIGNINLYLENPATGRFVFVSKLPEPDHAALVVLERRLDVKHDHRLGRIRWTLSGRDPELLRSARGFLLGTECEPRPERRDYDFRRQECHIFWVECPERHTEPESDPFTWIQHFVRRVRDGRNGSERVPIESSTDDNQYPPNQKPGEWWTSALDTL